MEYENLRKEKFAEEQKRAEDRLTQIKDAKAIGVEVPMASFVTEMSSGRDLSDIYLKHPGNESSEDEEGNEQEFASHDDEEREDENFQKFISSHVTKEENKVKLAQVQGKPWWRERKMKTLILWWKKKEDSNKRMK